ncbi:hypothetical protein Tco_0498717 [Tanacetum coccineum]
MIIGHENKAQVLYKDEYPQWKERFLGYIKDRPDSESLMKSIIEAPMDIPRRAPSVAHPLGRLIPKALERLSQGSKVTAQMKIDTTMYKYKTFDALPGESLEKYLLKVSRMEEAYNIVETDKRNYRFGS